MTGTGIVHLDTINHCLQKRTDFRKLITDHDLSNRVYIPSDGEWTRMEREEHG